jgi:hypothetical protein
MKRVILDLAIRFRDGRQSTVGARWVVAMEIKPFYRKDAKNAKETQRKPDDG